LVPKIYATRDHNNVTDALGNTKIMRRVIQINRRGMLTHGVVLLHDNAYPHTAASALALFGAFKLGVDLTALTLSE
jgi:hypothetical protein